jgi:hypothetical protein
MNSILPLKKEKRNASLSLLNRNFTVISDAGADVGRHEIYSDLKTASTAA